MVRVHHDTTGECDSVKYCVQQKPSEQTCPTKAFGIIVVMMATGIGVLMLFFVGDVAILMRTMIVRTVAITAMIMCMKKPDQKEHDNQSDEGSPTGLSAGLKNDGAVGQ